MIHLLYENHDRFVRFIAFILVRSLRGEENLIVRVFNSSEKRLARALLLLARCGAPVHPEKMLPKVSQEMLTEVRSSLCCSTSNLSATKKTTKPHKCLKLHRYPSSSVLCC